LIVLSVILLLIPLPQLGRVSDAIGDLLHVPLFALLAVAVRHALLHYWPSRKQTANFAAWISVSILGILAEYIQHFVGREASVGDAIADVCGATADSREYESLAEGSLATKLRQRLVGHCSSRSRAGCRDASSSTSSASIDKCRSWHRSRMTSS
jgi:hypothetical protein